MTKYTVYKWEISSYRKYVKDFSFEIQNDKALEGITDWSDISLDIKVTPNKGKEFYIQYYLCKDSRSLLEVIEEELKDD